MKGIILAGGTGSRLFPITRGISKQLMPIYDKPMIYYPITTLMKAGIKEILIITTSIDQERFKNLLGDGSQLGCKFEYVVQDTPRGLADAYLVGEEFIGDDDVTMILGDNVFYGTQVDALMEDVKENGVDGGLVFGYYVSNPRRYGVIGFDDKQNVTSIVEKPEKPASNYAMVGLYVTDSNVVEYAKNVKPSDRGELEIPDVINQYREAGNLKVGLLDRGTAWLDTGTFDSMNQASQFVQVIEERQGLKVGCIEEEAFRQGFIDANQLKKLAEPLLKSGYGEYLMQIAER